MFRLVKAEHLKLQHTFGRILTVIAPVITLLLALFLTGGVHNAFPAGAWNWWYIMLLPGMLAVFCYLSIKKDKKIKYYNILLLHISPEKCWIGKIIYCAFLLLFSNSIIFLGTLVGGSVLGTTISPFGGFSGAILLSISYMWAIPVYLFLSARFGMFASIFTSMVLSVSGVVALADTSLWWIFPFSIPIRLMCPTLGLLPNGLPIPTGSNLNNPNVILPGILLSLLWFFTLTFLTSIWFKRTEEK